MIKSFTALAATILAVASPALIYINTTQAPAPHSISDRAAFVTEDTTGDCYSLQIERNVTRPQLSETMHIAADKISDTGCIIFEFKD